MGGKVDGRSSSGESQENALVLTSGSLRTSARAGSQGGSNSSLEDTFVLTSAKGQVAKLHSTLQGGGISSKGDCWPVRLRPKKETTETIEGIKNNGVLGILQQPIGGP